MQILDCDTGTIVEPKYWNKLGNPIGENGKIHSWYHWADGMPLVIDTPEECREMVKIAVKAGLMRWTLRRLRQYTKTRCPTPLN